MIIPKKSPYFGLMNNNKVRYITMLRLELSPLKEHKFQHSFEEELRTGPGCTVCVSPETTEHYLLHCRSYTLSRSTLFAKVTEILNIDFSTLPRITQKDILLYGLRDLTDEQNLKILNFTIDFIVQNQRLDTY